MNKLSAAFLLLIIVLVALLLAILVDAKAVTFCHGYANVELSIDELSIVNKDLSIANLEAAAYSTYVGNTLILIIIHKQWDTNSVYVCEKTFRDSLKRLTGYAPEEGIPQRVK